MSSPDDAQRAPLVNLGRAARLLEVAPQTLKKRLEEAAGRPNDPVLKRGDRGDDWEIDQARLLAWDADRSAQEAKRREDGARQFGLQLTKSDESHRRVDEFLEGLTSGERDYARRCLLNNLKPDDHKKLREAMLLDIRLNREIGAVTATDDVEAGVRGMLIVLRTSLMRLPHDLGDDLGLDAVARRAVERHCRAALAAAMRALERWTHGLSDT
jgi:hypothetical protein